jgi:predicted enzyme related to lactoylglutathione lyase
MLRTIDCVMLRVANLDQGAAFYERVFGLRRTWRDETSLGMGLAESGTEIVLHTMDVGVSVHYLVDDVDAAVPEYVAQGCGLRQAPFDIVIGRCAVLADPFGNDIAILDMTKGPRG